MSSRRYEPAPTPPGMPVDLPLFRKRLQGMAIEVAQVRKLVESIPYEKRKQLPFPGPSGRNLWGTVMWWLYAQRFHLNVIEALPREEPWHQPGHPPVQEAEVWARWDECRRRIDRITRDYTEADWNREVDFWSDPSRTRKMLAWEVADRYFGETIGIEWVQVKEDLCHFGFQKDLARITGDDAAPYRSVTN